MPAGQRGKPSPRKSPQRGQEAQLPRVSKEGAIQHFAVALDGQLITAPSIDYTAYPLSPRSRIPQAARG